MEAPVLLVGLGGTGTRIVDTVYGKLTPEARENVAVHGFDTDVNDILKLQHIKGHMTQTSDDLTVWKCINQTPQFKDAVEAWFPEVSLGKKGQGVLGRKPLTEGAGQIRAVSRLAYFHTLRKSGMEILQKDINRLFKITGSDLKTTPRVFIVTTLAGGTGAGIFLQAALYIRKQLAEKYGKDVLVRGLFLLPDILVNTKTTQGGETADLRTNAYASIKELNAIVSSATDNTDTTIDLEVEPGQEKLSVDASPYDSCFLLDYENSQGNLGTGGLALAAYMQQAVDTLYLQVFSPISSGTRTVEDNLIRDNLAEDGLNFYGSAGVARLVYPYEDILHYCAIRKVQDSVQGQWLYIDDRFNEELESYKAAVANGESRPKPVLGKFYITQIESLGGKGTNHPFFTPLYKSIQQPDKRGRAQAENKVDAFIHAVRGRIETTLNNNNELQGYVEDLKDRPDAKNMKDRDQVIQEVREAEDAIYSLKEYVLGILIPESPNSLLYSILREDAGKESCLADNDDYRLNSWILKRDEPLHPVAVRYFLYDLEQKLTFMLAALKDSNNPLRGVIDSYEVVYDDIGTEGVVEDAEMRVQQALDKNRFVAFFGSGSFKQQVQEYHTQFYKMRGALKRYAERKIEQDLFAALLLCVKSFNKEWETFFGQLRGEQKTLDETCRFLENKHDNNSDFTTEYVRATADDKREIWEQVQKGQGGVDTDSELMGHLYCTMYKRFAGEYWQQTGKTLEKKQYSPFVEQLTTWGINVLTGNNLIDQSLAQVLHVATEDPMEMVRRTSRRATPWLTVDRGTEPRSFEYWGIHPENNYDQGGISKDAFGDAKVVADNSFSKYELINYQSSAGYLAEELTKFRAENTGNAPGAYFQAYQQARVGYLRNKKGSCTHHLDKNWHLPAYMPDINKEFAKIDESDRMSAFVNGLLNRKLLCQMNDGKRVWYNFKAETLPRTVLVKTHEVEDGYYNLYKALSHNPGIVDSVNGFSSLQREQDLKKHKDAVRKHDFCKGCQLSDEETIIDAILNFSEEHPHLDIEEQQAELMQHFGRMVGEYYKFCLGPKRVSEAAKKAKRFIQDTVRNSSGIAGLSKAKQSQWKEMILSAAAGV